MLIIPAIDLLDGKAVRLHKGQRDQVTVYHDNPVELVEGFAKAGARRLHLVDLNGAFAGARKHSDAVTQICQASPMPVEVGGGIRDPKSLIETFSDGATFAVLGTAAIKSPQFVEAACKAHPGKVIVAVDAVDGMVAVEGWVETSEISAVELGLRAAEWGAGSLLYTDVSRDGTGQGPNVEATAELHRACSIPVIASGGIGTLDHLRALRDAGVDMCVVGRALYDKNFSLEEAIAAAK